ncbi:MAG: sensor histidine kinase [Aeromonas sp.]
MLLKSRLFWKILLGFWLTIVLVSQVLWIAFSNRDHVPPEERLAQRLANQQLAAAAAVLADGGQFALQALLSAWPEQESRLVQVLPGDTPLPVTETSASTKSDISMMPPPPKPEGGEGHPPPDEQMMMIPIGPHDMFGPDSPQSLEMRQQHLLVRTVLSLDGKRYQLRYDLDGLRHLLTPPPNSTWHWLKMPPPMLWIGGLGGLIFSALFAWHLTRPMNALREGFSRVAAGDLGVRLLPGLRRRRDELTDVGRDFDSMVERLHQLVVGREQLLHDVSHELRSPLARIQLAIGLAEQNPDKVPGSLQRIQQETGRMDKLIGELLTLARVEQGQGTEQTYYDLQELVETVVADARFEGERAGVAVELFGELPVTLCGNAELVRRAIENVVRNALRFSKPGQSVAMQLGQEGERACVRIRDQGPGVEEEKLSAIFDPFVRIGSPMQGKGYGLGLAIARKAMLCQGGNISASNRPEGGLEVVLMLPLPKLN